MSNKKIKLLNLRHVERDTGFLTEAETPPWFLYLRKFIPFMYLQNLSLHLAIAKLQKNNKIEKNYENNCRIKINRIILKT